MGEGLKMYGVRVNVNAHRRDKESVNGVESQEKRREEEGLSYINTEQHQVLHP